LLKIRTLYEFILGLSWAQLITSEEMITRLENIAAEGTYASAP